VDDIGCEVGGAGSAAGHREQQKEQGDRAPSRTRLGQGGAPSGLRIRHG